MARQKHDRPNQIHFSMSESELALLERLRNLQQASTRAATIRHAIGEYLRIRSHTEVGHKLLVEDIHGNQREIPMLGQV